MVLLLCTTRSVVRIVGVTLDVVPVHRNTSVLTAHEAIGIVAGHRAARWPRAAAPGTRAGMRLLPDFDQVRRDPADERVE
jgi:hypothetical protein